MTDHDRQTWTHLFLILFVVLLVFAVLDAYSGTPALCIERLEPHPYETGTLWVNRYCPGVMFLGLDF